MATCVSCGDEYSDRRLSLGYHTCLNCGTPAPIRTVVPVHKSNYMLVTNRDELRLNPKLQG